MRPALQRGFLLVALVAAALSLGPSFAHVLEAGKFHIAFFDDRLGMPEYAGGQYQEAIAHGIRCVKMDPIACLMPMAMATERLGIGATYSTTYYEPFHVARMFASLDLMTKGRAAWNVVTSLNITEARNMGRDEVVEHDRAVPRRTRVLVAARRELAAKHPLNARRHQQSSATSMRSRSLCSISLRA